MVSSLLETAATRCIGDLGKATRGEVVPILVNLKIHVRVPTDLQTKISHTWSLAHPVPPRTRLLNDPWGKGN